MLVLIAALALAADPPPGGVPPLMPVYGVSTDGQGVTVQLKPAGCTASKSDFSVAVSKAADRTTILIARRAGAGSLTACTAQPRSVVIMWSYDDLGLKPGQPFSLANPLVMAP